jgi:hypothetical protein
MIDLNGAYGTLGMLLQIQLCTFNVKIMVEITLEQRNKIIIMECFLTKITLNIGSLVNG